MASALSFLARGGIAVGAASVFVNNFLYDVDGGQGAVLFDRFRGGIQDAVKTEGTSRACVHAMKLSGGLDLCPFCSPSLIK
jgi:hypothetical protein